MKKKIENVKFFLDRGVLAAWVLLALFFSLPAQQGFNQNEKESIRNYKRAREHFLKGGDYLNKGKFEKARNEADIALQVFPGYADAYLLVAELDYRQGQLEPALQAIETAKANFKKFSRFYEYSYLEYLKLLREERDYVDKHINDLTRQLINPMEDEARQKLEDVINRDKQTRDTLDTRLRNPIPEVLDIPAEYHYTHGNILFKMKRLNEAQGLYQAAIQADPKHANAYNNLINIFYIQGNMAQALEYLKQAESRGVRVTEGLKKAVLEKQP
ncbi:MAG: tetratricopeptide repeat protein [Candidatus Aminicenantes bacterium]|nr:tetratricopeptide repeat protein [Candidatus Aminicenantes bacterium]